MTPVFSYHLSRPCGRSSTFRKNCTNSFTIGSCAASECETNPSSAICVEANRQSYIDGSCGACPDTNETMPVAWGVAITWGDIDGAGPFTAGSYSFSINNNGSLIYSKPHCGFHAFLSRIPGYPGATLEADTQMYIDCRIAGGEANIALQWTIAATAYSHSFAVTLDMCEAAEGGGLVANYSRVLSLPMTVGTDPGGVSDLPIAIVLYPAV
jgi:hypothetical protein